MCGLLVVAAAVTWTPSSAAGPLALAHSDYPHGAHIAVVAATNAAADRYLAPVHRSTFERLHRLDGSGWLQFGTWTFRTGSGTSSETHQTVFGYGVNLFSSAARAANALKDVKIPTKRYRVAHLNGRRFISTDAAQTLVFVFFQYRTAEIEAYYQYTGVAPRATAKSLRHTFATQLSHLAHLARLYTQHPPLPTATRVLPTPAPTDTPVPTDTATPTSTSVPAPTDTPTSLPTATSLPTSIPSPTPTSTPMPTPTPVNYAVTASMPQKTFSPGEAAVVNAHVSLNGQPAAGVKIVASYAFPNGAKQCEAVTDSAGNASCSVLVTPGNGGQTIVVNVEAIAPGGYTAETTTSFRAGG